MTFDDNKTRDWNRTTLNDGLFFNAEFNRIYTNLSDVDGRIVNLNDGLSTITQYAYSLIAGMIQGGIFWDADAGTIVLNAGRYEVSGNIQTLTANQSLSLVTQCYGNDVLENDTWYYTLMNSASSIRCQIAVGDVVHEALEVNSVSDQGGGILQITFRNSPDLAPVSSGMNFRSDDLSAGNAGIFKITAVDPVNYRILLQNNKGGTIAAATDAVGTGSIYAGVAAVNTPNPIFDVSRQGYYDGDWRILGVDFYEFDRGHRWVRSYKSGYDKNDNELILQYFSGQGTLNTHIPEFSEVIRQWGHDYSLNQDDGAQITFSKNGMVQASYCGYSHDNDVNIRGFSLNATAAPTNGGNS